MLFRSSEVCRATAAVATREYDRWMKATAVVTLLAATLTLAGCGSDSMGTATGGSTAGTGAAAPSARNLAVDAAVRSQLVAAGAALHHLKSADYTGLVKGETSISPHLQAQFSRLSGGNQVVSTRPPSSLDANVRPQVQVAPASIGW